MGVPNPEASPGNHSDRSKTEHSNLGPIRFGPFELRPATRELLKDGIRLHLQSKPYQVLETLLLRPGDLITREELQRKLWPSGTFVDFESGLNTAINRLRVALSDSADEPRYIETLPRLGYRLICGVQREVPTVAENPVKPVAPEQPPLPGPVQPVLSHAAARPSSRSTFWWITAAAAFVLVGVTFLFVRWMPGHRTPPIDFQPVTLRGGAILSARFLPDSRIIYTLSNDRTRQAFVADSDGANTRSLPNIEAVEMFPYGSDLAALSYTSNHPAESPVLRLSRLDWQGHPLSILADRISGADWSADGRHLAVVRATGSESQLESPPGHVIYRSQGMLDNLRLSPNGREIALLEHPTHDDDAGHVVLLDGAGSVHKLAHEWGSADGLAWAPSGHEVWFTASEGGLTRSLYAVTTRGALRKLSQQPVSLRLLDVSKDDRALLSLDDLRMLLRMTVEGHETEISPFDFSHAEDLSRDGHLLLFTESGDAGGPHYAAFTYDFCKKQARRFGSGRALALSPDRKRALTMDPRDRNSLTLTMLDSGAAVQINGSGFLYQWAKFRNDSELIVGGSFPGKPLQMALQNVISGKLTPLSGVPYLSSVVVSPDGQRLAGRLANSIQLVDLLPTPKVSPLAGLVDDPLVWSTDGRSLFVLSRDRGEFSILNYDLATARTSVWKTIDTQHSLAHLAGIAVAPEAGAYAWSAHIELSRLYLAGHITSGS